MMKLRINPLVAKDLKSIKDYIAEDNADKALETIQEIYSQFENIQQFPYIGVDLSKRVSFKTDYKYVVWKDYVVLYKVGKKDPVTKEVPIEIHWNFSFSRLPRRKKTS